MVISSATKQLLPLLLSAGWTAFAAQANVTDLGVLPGGLWSSASAVNNAGQVVGYSDTAGGAIHAVLWEKGRMTDLGTLPGCAWSFAYAINNRGQIAGYSCAPGGQYRAVLWEKGAIINLGALLEDSVARGINDKGEAAGTALVQSVGSSFGPAVWDKDGYHLLDYLPDGGYGAAYSINNRGHVAGEANTAFGAYRRATLWIDGKPTDLGTLPGGLNSIAWSVNSLDEVVGLAYVSDSVYHAFRWERGIMTDLGTLAGGATSTAMGINNRGEIVGQSDLAGGPPHAVLWKGGELRDLSPLLGSTGISSAYGINDSGDIVGACAFSGGMPHAYLLRAH